MKKELNRAAKSIDPDNPTPSVQADLSQTIS